MTSGPAARSRRWFLALFPAGIAFAADRTGKGRVFPSAVKRFADAATEFPVLRLTDPAHTSFLPAASGRAVSRRNNFLIYASDRIGSFEAFHLDFKTGQSRQLTESSDLDPASLTLFGEDRDFAWFDGNRMFSAGVSSLKTREHYEITDGFERGAGLSVSEDSQHAAIVEKKGTTHRLQLIHLSSGNAVKLVECDEELRDPLPRPRRASILYRRAGAVWLANYDGRQNYRLKLAEGETGPATWSPDGRSVLYLNYPSDPHRLHNIREFIPDTNEDRMIAQTSQYVGFAPNTDASVFVGASGSKASPYVLLLVRAVQREMTLAEHRASDPKMVAPIFSPNSQRVFFTSDRDGKPAIYSMSVAKLVEETASAN